MEYKEPKKRVTKSDKKLKNQVYSQKHIRNILKQMEASKDKKRTDGSLHPRVVIILKWTSPSIPKIKYFHLSVGLENVFTGLPTN